MLNPECSRNLQTITRDFPNKSATFFVSPLEGEEAPIPSALEREDVRADKAGDWDDAAGRSSLGKPRCVLGLLSICAGHSRTSD